MNQALYAHMNNKRKMKKKKQNSVPQKTKQKNQTLKLGNNKPQPHGVVCHSYYHVILTL
jgi:hypothetical protein